MNTVPGHTKHQKEEPENVILNGRGRMYVVDQFYKDSI